MQELVGDCVFGMSCDRILGNDFFGVKEVDVSCDNLRLVLREWDEAVLLLSPVAVHGTAEELGTRADDAFVDAETLLVRNGADDDGEKRRRLEAAIRVDKVEDDAEALTRSLYLCPPCSTCV